MGKRKELRYWNIPVPTSLNLAVEKALTKDTHVSKSDFVRDAVRHSLDEIALKQHFFKKNNLQETK